MMPIAKFATGKGGASVTHLVQSVIFDEVRGPIVEPLCACDLQVVRRIEHVVSMREFATCDNPCPECKADWEKRSRLL